MCIISDAARAAGRSPRSDPAPGPAAAPAGDRSGQKLVGQLFAIVDRGGQRGFHAFLPDLLRDALGAAGVQAGGVRAVRAGVLALRQQLLQLIEERPVAGGRVEATAVAEVAGRADRVGQYQQRVVIAVRRDADHFEEVAGAFTLVHRRCLVREKR